MRLPAIRKFLKRLFYAVLTLLVFGVAAAIWFTVHCPAKNPQPKVLSAAAIERQKLTADIKDYARPEDDTFLTYAEWYIVWSYQEKADFQEHHLPSAFPYLQDIKQYWSAYCCAFSLVRGRYPFNVGDHVMLVVIGSSFSVEYALKGLYENTVGRLAEWTASRQPTDDDLYAYRTARAYADFVHIRPFYEFSFWTRFKGLWSETKLWGPHPIRKWERKSFLSLDYAIEAFYCQLIEWMTHASYGVEPPDTFAWIENASDVTFAANPRIRKIKTAGPGAYIVAIPRYQEFTAIATQLARQNVHFVEIAGNDEILLTLLAPSSWPGGIDQAEVVFSAEIPTRPHERRFGLKCSVGGLDKVLVQLADRGINVEHIYDY
jgi:hypothetical protein